MTIDDRMATYRRNTASDFGAKWIGTSPEAISEMRRLQRERAQELLADPLLTREAIALLTRLVDALEVE